MNLRDFKDHDAEFCFRTRSAAFVEKFYDEVGPEIVSLCVNEYMPRDYVAVAAKENMFIAEDGGERVGFCRLRRVDEETAEIVLIYMRLDRLGRGYGTEAMRLLEAWIGENWPEVRGVVIETIIPENTRGFYLKMGYEEVGEAVSVFSGREVPAVRFRKGLGPPA